MTTTPDHSLAHHDHDEIPCVGIDRLEQLWFQVAGTRCNLACNHCFISCHPRNRSFGFLSLNEVARRLEESVPLGVREYYFTGGEPFLNPEMTNILVETLKYGPATVLTNGTVLRETWLEQLRRAEQESIFSLEFRVSIDGFTAEWNDPIRGKGTFERALAGVQRLVQFGFMPIITAVRTWEFADDASVLEAFMNVLRERGYARPRIKLLPTLQMGAEVQRTSGYSDNDLVTREMMEGFDESLLVCNSARIVTDRGVHVCPILIESDDSLLGQTLESALRPFPLGHGACTTCYRYGAICSNSVRLRPADSNGTDKVEKAE